MSTSEKRDARFVCVEEQHEIKCSRPGHYGDRAPERQSFYLARFHGNAVQDTLPHSWHAIRCDLTIRSSYTKKGHGPARRRMTIISEHSVDGAGRWRLRGFFLW